MSIFVHIPLRIFLIFELKVVNIKNCLNVMADSQEDWVNLYFHFHWCLCPHIPNNTSQYFLTFISIKK